MSPRVGNAEGAVAHVAAWIRSEGDRCPPDREEAERFLRALDPQADTFSFRTFSDTSYTRLPGTDPLESELRGTLGECWAGLAERNRAGAAVCVRVNRSEGRGQAPEPPVQARALFADLDRPWPFGAVGCLVPHLLVQSSPGHHHGYWLVERLPLDRFRSAEAALLRLLDADHRAGTIHHALRLPGFWHRKDPCQPWRVMLVEQRSSRPYTLADLAVLGITP